jgi:hypothetical protein
LFHVATADSSLFAHVLDRNGTAKNSNGDIAALAEEILDPADIGTDTIMAGDRLGRFVVAAVDGAVAATAILTGHIGGGSNGEGSEREDDSFGEHVEGSSKV